jgi:translation initiation factor IF-1
MLEGNIDEILRDGRLGAMLDNQHRIIAFTADKMRKHRIRSLVGDRVHVEMAPYDLSKGRIVFRERTPGQGGPARRNGFRREVRRPTLLFNSANRGKLKISATHARAPIVVLSRLT